LGDRVLTRNLAGKARGPRQRLCRTSPLKSSKFVTLKKEKQENYILDQVIAIEFILLVQKVLPRREVMANTSNQTGSSSPNFRIDVIFNSLRELQQGL